jgi:predicted transcriptional regulator
MKNRSRLDISAKILEVAQVGAIKTRIMYDSFLSFPQLSEYLEFLEQQGALDYVESERKYYTTKRGMDFLRGYKEPGQLLSPMKIRAAKVGTRKTEAVITST